MDLSKAFEYILHDLLIGKVNAYGFNRNLVRYIYSNLERRKQYVRMNIASSNFKYIFSGVLQRLVLGVAFFKISFNDFFFCMLIVSAHNFADDNSLGSNAITPEDLIEPLLYL